MNYLTYGGPSSRLRVLSIFTFYYLACQLAAITLTLAYIGSKELTKDKGGIAIYGKGEKGTS